MANFELVVMCAAGLLVARVAWSVLKYAAVACISKIHGEEMVKEYPKESLEWLRKYGL